VTADIRARLAAVDAAVALATPGPWAVSEDAIGGADIVSESTDVYVLDDLGAMYRADAAAIVALRNTGPAAVTAVQAVLQLHVAVPRWRYGPNCCETCRVDWPCPTVAAVSAAFGDPR